MKIIQFPKSEMRSTAEAAGAATLILPVAQRSLARIRYDRTDSEARAIPPSGALRWISENLEQGAVITGVELAGPGDPLAEVEYSLETLRLIGQKHPALQCSLTTLGLHGEQHAAALALTGITKVTLLVDAVEREVADKLYAWIRPGNKTIPLTRSVPILLEEQQRAAGAFKKLGITVTVRTTVYPGVNDDHVAVIARTMAGCGAEAMALVPCNSAADKEEALLSPPTPEVMRQLAESAARYLPTTVLPEKETRLGVDCSSLNAVCKSPAAAGLKPTGDRPNVAVVSMSGMDVDLHLGQAYQALIYGPREDGLICLLASRPVPEPGSGSTRWEELAENLSDCFALLAASAGESPRRILAGKGITVLITDGEIEGTIDLLYGGGSKGKKKWP